MFDVAVIGGGPAGMMAAGRAAELGARVILLEKNDTLGKKLLLTGKGRCNITNAEFNLKKLVENYGLEGKFLFHAFSMFGPRQVIDFFNQLGLETKIERGQRVFPISDGSIDVLKALVKYLDKNKANIVYDSKILEIKCQKNKIEKLVLKNKEIISKNYIICTGGKSYASTGSTGDGFEWAKKLGHQIKELSPALVPIVIKEGWVRKLQGLSLKNVEISVIQKNKKEYSKFGECLFAHFGITGPIILDISKIVGKLLKKGEVELSLDLKPALDFVKLDQRLQRDFVKFQRKLFKNSLNDLLPRKLIPVIINLSKIDPEKKINSITKKERQDLVKLLKGLKMTAKELLGFGTAIVTSGGVSLEEIDHKTMKSKLINNLYFAGEIIDVDGPTGGFNLQNCWSTGYLAGESAAK
ncbi:NAD(P)/FAD-dependent oxidoreductase [Candidatus Parcubacteria bacterium]|nr:NAD(P)/FAD-dependent oxidoreductase [Candidatus Parcubacteria bacterium]